MTPKKVLIVDDEVSITRLLKLNLEKTGLFIVRDENRASQALQAAKEFKPDVVLLDVMMPEMDGGDVAALIRSQPLFQNIPIIFLTAVVKEEEINAHDGYIGGFPYLAKPLNAKTLIATIEKHLGMELPKAA
jgi:two-component system OmpR family response regulator